MMWALLDPSALDPLFLWKKVVELLSDRELRITHQKHDIGLVDPLFLLEQLIDCRRTTIWGRQTGKLKNMLCLPNPACQAMRLQLFTFRQ